MSELGNYKILKINQVIFFLPTSIPFGVPLLPIDFLVILKASFWALGIPTWKKGSSSIGAKKLIGWSPLDTTRYYVYVPDP